jgi:KaiC/GvpD/RAD55 family RecA-like ATPase
MNDISTTTWTRTVTDSTGTRRRDSTLRMPTLGQLLGATFKERRHLLAPWLREQESCMVYADTGVGKSLFALSAAIAVAGGGSFLGWSADTADKEGGWRVLYIDGEMHIADVQERARSIMGAVEGIDQGRAADNLMFLPRQFQRAGAAFPLITDPDGMKFILDLVHGEKLDLVILDNFSTLGEVEDENSAASFNAIQQFLLELKVHNVATMLVHHAGKSGDFRGSSKLAATFETILRLDRVREKGEAGEAQFRVRWDKVRAGGPGKSVREIIAKLTQEGTAGEPEGAVWEYEAGDLSRLDETKEKLKAGEFINLKEIADYFGLSKPMGRRTIDRGISLGIWTEVDVKRWLAKGKQLRNLGKTAPPLANEIWSEEMEGEEREPNPDF